LPAAGKRCPINAVLVLALLWCALSFQGCSTTLHEEKAKDADDEGSLTEFKADAEELKVVHSF
jgi:hypothetical protein